MDEVFRDLEKAGKTDVDNMIKWMKSSKVVETLSDEKVKELFKDVANRQHVELDKFKEIVEALAVQQHKTFEQLAQQLATEGPKLIDAAIVGLTAFKEALKENK